MARIRSVHPSICESEDLVTLPAEMERTYVRLWTHCDDDGRAKDNPRLIKAAIYPLHDDMTVAVVDAHLSELERRGHLIRYEIDGVGYLAISNASWAKYQRPQKKRPSVLPEPPDRQPVELPDVSRSSTRPVEEESGPVVVVVEGVVGEREQPPDSSRTHHALLRPDAPPSLLCELDDVLNALLAVHADDDVDAAVQQLTDQRLRFPFPSDVRRALEAILGRPVVVKPSALDETQQAQHAAMDRTARRKRGEVCPFCEDRGVVELEDGTFDDCRCKSLRSA